MSLLAKINKQFFNKILTVFCLFCLAVTLLSIALILIGKYSPNAFTNIDNLIPDLYGEKIQTLYASARNSVTPLEKYKYFNKLHTELKDIDSFNKYNKLSDESAYFLINYHTHSTNYKQALDVAELLKKKHPLDLNAQFVFIDVLAHIDKIKSLNYIRNLLNKDQNNFEITEEYMSYFFENHINEDDVIDRQNEKDGVYQVFAFKDSPLGLPVIFSGKRLPVNFNKNFFNYNGMRINKKKIPSHNIVTGFDIKLNNKNLFSSKKNKLNRANKIVNKKKCNNPHFIFNVQGQLQNNINNLNITCHIFLIDISKSQFLKNSEWRVYVDSSIYFNNKESFRFDLKNDTYDFEIHHLKTYNHLKRIRFDLPSVVGLKIHDFKITINKESVYTKNDISSLNSIENKGKYLLVTNKDPYVILNLKKELDMTSFAIVLDLEGVKKDEI